MSYIKVKAINFAIKVHNIVNRDKAIKPSIDRINDYKFNRMGKYYAGPTQNKNGTPSRFYQVNDGKHIRYYGMPFWNLYRVVSKNGSDFVIHRAK